MSDFASHATTGAGSEAILIACATDAVLNRVPRSKLGHDPRCGKCHRPLFLGRPVELTSGNFGNHVLKSELPVVIDFWAAWCGPCRTMSPNFAAAAAQLEPDVRLAKLDTEAEQALAARYGIQGIPTLIMLRQGREVARVSGAMPTQAIVRWVREALR